MKRIVLTVTALVIVSAANAAQPSATKDSASKGRQLLEKAAAAVKRVKQVRYVASYEATNWIVPMVPKVTGTAVLGERSKWKLPSFRCDVAIQSPGSSETVELVGGSDGNMFFMIDPSTKMAHEDMDSAVMGKQQRTFQRVVMVGFGSPEPFKESFEADSIELSGTVRIGDEECHEIHVKDQQPPEMVFYLSTKDLLPRKLVRIYPNQREPEGEKGTTELTISKLEINPKFAKNPFKLEVPAGFTKTDEFAP